MQNIFLSLHFILEKVFSCIYSTENLIYKEWISPTYNFNKTIIVWLKMYKVYNLLKKSYLSFFYPVLVKKKNLFLFAFSFPVKICEFI